MTPELRAVIVKNLSAALADAWRRQQPFQNDERPEPLAAAAGRNIHQERIDEPEQSNTPT
ncbi:MAG: hypothetical protein ABIR92_11120 [Gemmatimonadaceae bacterium]